MSSLACICLGRRCVLTTLSLVFVLVFTQFSQCLLRPDCSAAIIIGDNQTMCQRTPRPEVINEWRCSDLQSALEAAENLFIDLPEQQNSPSCISIEVPPGDHLITTPIHFNATSVYIYGIGERANNVTIFCNYTVDVDESRIFDLDYDYTDYTFYFNRSEVVSFECVQFVGCPYPLRLDTVATVRVHNSIFRKFTEAVFDIFNSANVSLTNSTFANNRGTGISRYSFRANTGAVSIGYNNVPKHFQFVAAKVTECKFTTNKATAFHKVRSTNAAFFSKVFSGRGGGLGVFCDESFYNISLTLVNNRFEKNYARSFGGALYFVTFGEGTQNVYSLDKNVFINNSAPLGGGAISNTFFSNGVPGSPHQLLMTDCIYEGNLGQSGGALSLYLPYGAQGVSYIQCKRCYFVDNHGNNTDDEYGGAIAIYRVNQFESRDSVPRYDFIDCTFENNSGNNGIFTVAHFPITFSGNTRFVGNRGTDTLKIIGSLIDFRGQVIFRNNANFRTNSVAIHMQSFAQLRFNSGLGMIFSENSGAYGASILVGSPTASLSFGDLTYNPQCFVIYEDKSSPPGEWDNVSVSFQRNTAVLGSSISISRLNTCSWVSANADPSNAYVYDWPIWDFGNSSINTAYMDSYNAEHSFVTTSETLVTNNSIRAWPGQWFTIQLTGIDQFEQKTTFAARFNNVILNHPAQMPEDILVSFNPDLVINYATRNVSLVRNFKLKYHISFVEALGVDGPHFGTVTVDDPIQSVVVKPATFLLHPTLCPPGYILKSISTNPNITGLECQCDPNIIYKQIIHCESDQDTIIVEDGYWGTAILDSFNYRYDLFLHPCPPGYCKCSRNTSLGSSSCAFTYTNSDPDAQCANSRKGTLCGECRGGMGVSVLFNECVTCHNAQALLILALIIADAITFCVIIAADIPLFEWMYPYFFYIQAVATVAIYFPLNFLMGGKFLLFINSALNFYFAYDFCLYSNMSPLVSYFIKYLPIFVFVLILPAVPVFREKKMLMLKHHGVWWIIVFLYTHLVHTSMSILACPFLPDSLIPRSSWFFSGNMQCFNGWHIPLSLLAIAALVVAVLFIPLVCLISRKQHLIKKFYWFKYFEDPLTHAYKEEWRWWSAVELARRFVFILFVIPFPRNPVLPMCVLCVMLVVYGITQPYKRRTTNVMEMLIQINFILLLTLESSGYLKDTYSVFLIPETPANNNLNTTLPASAFNDRISSLTKILLPFYYLPVFSFIITAIVNLSPYIRKWRASRTKDLLLSRSIEIIDPVKMTELKIGDDSEYAMMTVTATYTQH